jgi:hypothetical protein
LDGAAKRAADQGGLAQHRTPQLLGVCREVTFSTGPQRREFVMHEAASQEKLMNGMNALVQVESDTEMYSDQSLETNRRSSKVNNS